MQSLERGMTSTYFYQENCKITFSKSDSDELSVTIDTENLHLRSVKSEQSDHTLYYNLFNDMQGPAQAVQSIASKFFQMDEVKEVVNGWSDRWKSNDPYSSLAVFRNVDNEFVGNVNLGHGDQPGESRLSCRFMKAHQGKGYGKEAVTAVIKGYAPATIKENYTLNGKTLEMISIIARNGNSDITSFFQELGMDYIGIPHNFGPDYSLFSLKV